jgi:hypothetical protein
MWPMLVNGWCGCCGRTAETTAGCGNCMSRTYCSCGAVLACGTHLLIEDHKCPRPWEVPDGGPPLSVHIALTDGDLLASDEGGI